MNDKTKIILGLLVVIAGIGNAAWRFLELCRSPNWNKKLGIADLDRKEYVVVVIIIFSLLLAVVGAVFIFSGLQSLYPSLISPESTNIQDTTEQQYESIVIDGKTYKLVPAE